jgi:hypothetical protein
MDMRSDLRMFTYENDARRLVSKAPKRLSITIPHSTYEAIAERSNAEGRSLSNLAAFLLERGISA